MPRPQPLRFQRLKKPGAVLHENQRDAAKVYGDLVSLRFSMAEVQDMLKKALTEDDPKKLIKKAVAKMERKI